MESNCLLELPIEETNEILSEVNLKPPIQSTESTDSDVGGMLLDNPVENHGVSAYSTSGIDFEFVNSELGSGSAYTMDHSSVFDISESVIDEKSELFRDTEVFDDCLIKHNDLDKLQNLNLDLQSGRKLIMDLGLKLQIIPLNNLKFVSTIQTSEGVHIVALPDTSNLSQKSDPSQPLIRDIFPQLGSNQIHIPASVGGKDGRSEELHVFDMSSSQKTGVTKVIQVNSSSLDTQHVSQQTSKSSADNSPHSINDFQKDHESPSVRSLLNLQKESRDKTERDLHNTEGDKALNRYGRTQKPKKQRKDISKSLTEMSLETLKGKLSDRTVKESKIIIDLRKLMPQRKPRRMVSLLNNPKTYKLFANNQLKMNHKCNTNTTLKPVKNIFKDKKGLSVVLDKSSNEALKTKATHAAAVNLRNKPDTEKKRKTNVKRTLNGNNGTNSKRRKSSTGKIAAKDKISTKVIKKSNRYNCSYCQAKFIRLGNHKNHISLHRNADLKFKHEEHEKQQDGVTPDKSCKEIEHVDNIETELRRADVLNDNSLKVSDIDIAVETDVCITEKNEILVHTTIDKLELKQNEISVEVINGIKDMNGTTKMMIEPDIPNAEQTAVNVTEGVMNENGEVKADNSVVGKKIKFLCSICQLSFSSEGNLTRHQLTHMKSGGRYPCTMCEKSFHQQCDLKRHQITHTDQLPFTCNICCKGFLRKSDLTGHEKFHSKEKTYKCDQCSKSYYQAGDLQRHIRQSHSDLCQFACLYCTKKYTAERSLFTHVRSKHKQHSV